jgi:Plasmid encoded RepA protein
MEIAEQLQLVGLEETTRRVTATAASDLERKRLIRRIEVTHDLLSNMPTMDDLSFLHSGLCQTCLPHKRPAKNSTIWRRSSGRFRLMVTPGVLDSTGGEGWDRPATADENESLYVGVPYGAKARLILIHLQTEGMKSRTVNLGPSLSAFMRSLGIPVTGGAGNGGNIAGVREQCVRISRASFTLQWEETTQNGTRTLVTDTRIVDSLELWKAARGKEWTGSIELSPAFHEHLTNHAVPLDKRAIAQLSRNSLGLDLYTLLAYRLPRLREALHLRWVALQSQFGAEDTTKELARRIRDTLPQVIDVYPWANVEVLPTGLTLYPSKPAVPKTMVNGWRMIDGTPATG